jgi:hypothetical protein
LRIVTAAIAFIACAAVRAQIAYRHRSDGPLVARLYVNSAIRLGLMALVCFVVAKMLP